MIKGETIPHNEKVFSIFEEHTKWIVKGKAGVRQELGLIICVIKDQFGFIPHHRVMEDESDVLIAVPIITVIARLNARSNFDRFQALDVLIVDPSTAIVNLLDHFVRSPAAASLVVPAKQCRWCQTKP